MGSVTRAPANHHLMFACRGRRKFEPLSHLGAPDRPSLSLCSSCLSASTISTSLDRYGVQKRLAWGSQVLSRFLGLKQCAILQIALTDDEIWMRGRRVSAMHHDKPHVLCVRPLVVSPKRPAMADPSFA